MFVPAIARRLYVALLGVSNVLKHGGPRVDVVLTVIAVASVVVFTGLRTSTNLLGDGQLIAQSYDAAWEGNDRVIMRSVEAIVLEEQIAPGATLMYYGAAKVITRFFDKGPVWGIRLFNCLLGALFVYIVLGFLRHGPFSPEIRLWLLVLALFSTFIQLFFGYVENYTPLVFTGFLYVLAGFLLLHDRSRIWIVILLFLITFYTHIQAVLFAPSLVYLIVWRVAKSRRKVVERHGAVVLIVLTVLVAIAAVFTPFGQYYLPLKADEQSYGLFSPVHLVDVLNEILMLMPIVPVFLVMAWINRRIARSDGTGEKGSSATGWFAMRSEWQFVLVMLVPCLVYLFLFKPEIGMARDWDLFTMTSLALVPLTLLIINRFFRLTRLQAAAGSFSSPAIVIYLVLGVAWIGINASPARSTARFARILEYDRTHASYAYENLSIFYYDNGNLEKAVEMIEIACDISRNPRQYVRLAMYYSEQNRIGEATDLMRQTLARHPDFGKARFYLISLLEKQNLIDELYDVAVEGTKYHPDDAIYWFYVGEVSLHKGRIEEGIAAHRKCLTLNPPDKARERCLEQIRKYTSEGK
jgi:hypothetical protein